MLSAFIPTLPTVAAADLVELEPYTVTAAHFAEPAARTPVQVDLIIPGDWQHLAAASLPELLTRLAGLETRSFTGSPRHAVLSLRGFGEGASQRVLLLVDGLRLNRPDMGAPDWALVPSGRIAQVEVLRGSHAVLYGNQAVGGVIKVTSRRPEQPYAETSLLAGADGQREGSLLLGTAGRGWQLGVDAQRQRADGYRANSASAADSIGLRGGIDLVGGWHADLSLSHIDSSAQLPGGLFSAAFPAQPRVSIFNDQHSGENAWLGQLRLARDAAAAALIQPEAVFVAGHRRIGWDFSGTHAANRIGSAGAQLRALVEPGAHRLIGGVDLLQETVAFRQFTDATRSRVFTTAALERQSLSLYLHERWAATARSDFQAGVRGEWIRLDIRHDRGHPFRPDEPWIVATDREQSDRAWAVQTGWTYRPRADRRLWARLDRFFRHPATDEIAAYQGYELSEPFRATLRPESGWNLEGGGACALAGGQLELALFRQWMEDEIQFDPVRNRNDNLPHSRRQGVELGWLTERPAWALRLGWSWTEAVLRAGPHAGRRLPLVPRHSLRASAAWRPAKGWEAALHGRYLTSQIEGNDYANVQPRLPAHAVWDCTLAWQARPGLRLFAAVHNLLDRGYAALKYQGQWYPEPGRTWRAGLRYAF